MSHGFLIRAAAVFVACWFTPAHGAPALPPPLDPDPLQAEFLHPPDAARPWVYWFWMDGNISREGITADLEAMHRVGIGGLLLMEVDVGVPRGPVKFMSPEWRELFRHAVLEAERLGLQITLNAGPGWTGSGGPWVQPEQSMQHLVASTVEVTGPLDFDRTLPQAAPRDPHFVHAPLPASLQPIRDGFYRDVAVLAFPTPEGEARIAGSDEKALYYRNPYSSSPGVKASLPTAVDYPALPSSTAIEPQRVLDLSRKLGADGRLPWRVPEGRWTIMRFGRTSTGANTRPAPVPGIGLESDKFDRDALESHFDAFVGTLLRELGPRPADRKAGWTMLHIDSWEMGSQNWSPRFRDEFTQRRGYDPLPFLPAFTGRIVGSPEISERFLWDVRQTAQELVVENHARHLKHLGRAHGFGLSIEPYDMNPCSDLSLGGEADVPMGEFWARGYGFETSYSCLEAISLGHTLGRSVIAAESFTADAPEAWKLYPGAMKAQADWAFAFGLNRLVIHRYAHQPWLDRRPGMTMGPYGVHYERTQTWWELAGPWHAYLARCQFLLRRGTPVADILYLASEGAPNVFRPPPSALEGNPAVPDRRAYNFDAGAPEIILNLASVRDGRLTLPGGATYHVLVLPELQTMTPALLRKLVSLVREGATVVGPPPAKSPSLSGYPDCDAEVARLASELWGPEPDHAASLDRVVGKGRVVNRRKDEPSKTAPAPALPPDAHWIWHANDGSAASAAPVASRWFSREFDCPDPGTIASAQLSLTADNTFEAALNGQRLGAGDNFRQLYVFDLTPHLRPGTNTLTILAGNGGDTPNPAGLIAAVELRHRDGGVVRLATDTTWQSSTAPGQTTEPARVLGTAGMAPWGQPAGAAGQEPTPPYGDYDGVAGLLRDAGIPPDFESSASLRYAHRQEGETDIYFLSNREPAPVRATCTFRVQGRQPELWDPLTGRVRPLPEFRQVGKRAEVPLAFEPHGSWFVLFRKPAGPAPPATARNFVPVEPVLTVAGPWEVEFASSHGAPERVTLTRLSDWTTHPNPAVRHFSGTATYRTTFEVTSEQWAGLGAGRAQVDLGEVAVMAQLRLNGRDLGVAWTIPYRLAIQDGLRVGLNALEIRVANLWPNRLIGDLALPDSERTTWTTWNPYKPDSPLLKSGLIGPVTLVRERRLP